MPQRYNSPPKSITLTSHPTGAKRNAPKIAWGAASPVERGPVVGSFTEPLHRNAIGAHSGSYALYRALAVAAGQLSTEHRPDLTYTDPAEDFPPQPSWSDPAAIVSMDPWGHMIKSAFGDWLDRGVDARPTIAITKAWVQMLEINQAMDAGRLKPDGEILLESGHTRVTKIAVEPVWYLPGIAARFQIEERDLRRRLFEETGGMFPELVTRDDLRVFLPPIGGQTIYVFGPPERLWDPHTPVACRVHDECNGSDVFGSDICTCRPYLTHGIEVCLEMAQQGGGGLIVYNRKEGRALGEVTKFLVYNARKRQPGGDRAEAYFERTECVAGVQDMRFQELMPDVLVWLGIKKLDRFVSMSNMKSDAIRSSGIEIGEQVEIPAELIPPEAMVEMDAKRAAGYHTEKVPDADTLAIAKGRGLTS